MSSEPTPRTLARHLGVPQHLDLALCGEPDELRLVRGRAEIRGERLRVHYRGRGWTLTVDIVEPTSAAPSVRAWASYPGCETNPLIDRRVARRELLNLQSLLHIRRRGARHAR